MSEMWTVVCLVLGQDANKEKKNLKKKNLLNKTKKTIKNSQQLYV